MRKVIVCLLFIFLFSGQGIADEIYGYIQGAGNAEVKITCSKNRPYVNYTDNRGAYRVNVQETGKCQVQVKVGQTWSFPAELFSYARPTRYNFVVDNESNPPRLRRK